jgi:predicted Ser/Thr protein kinase
MGCSQSKGTGSAGESNETRGKGVDGWEAGTRSSTAFLKVQPRPSDHRSSAETAEFCRRSQSSANSSSVLPAFVLCDFVGEPDNAELSVRRGQFVEVIVGELPAPPEGWCVCRLRREGRQVEDERGLVPWTHLVSAVHAELDAIAEHEPAGSAATLGVQRSSIDVLPQSRSRTVAVRRTPRGFGIDVSEKNVLVRVVPGSAAAEDGYLQVGDVVLSVDGEPLNGRWLPHVLSAMPRRPVHQFVVLAEDAMSADAEAVRRSFARKKALSRSGRSSGLRSSSSPREYDILSTMDLSNIYALKSWNMEDNKRSAVKYQYFSYEGRDVPIELDGLPSATVAAGAATRGGRMCAPSEVLSAASRLQPAQDESAAGVRSAPSGRPADPDLAAAKLFSSLDPSLGGGAVPIHALWLVDVQQDLVSGALAQNLDKAEAEKGRSAADIVERINTLRRQVPFEIVCMSMRAAMTAVRKPKPADALERGGYEVEVPVGATGPDGAATRFYGYSRREAARVLQHMAVHKVTHVWVCGLAPEGAVLVSALHAAEAGLATVILSDCSRACSLTAGGGIDTRLLNPAAVALVPSTAVKPLRALSSWQDATAAANKANEVRSIVTQIGADTGTPRPMPTLPAVRGAAEAAAPPRGYEAAPEMSGPGAVYRIAGDTVPSWVFAQLQERQTRLRYQLGQQEADQQIRAQQPNQPPAQMPTVPPIQLFSRPPPQSAADAFRMEPTPQPSAQPVSAASVVVAAAVVPAGGAAGEGGPGHRRIDSTGGRKLAAKSKPFWEIMEDRKHRQAPKAPAVVSTMRMGEMLEEARKGAEAAGTPEARAYFEQILARYKQHPSVQKRQAKEAEAGAARASAIAFALAESERQSRDSSPVALSPRMAVTISQPSTSQDGAKGSQSDAGSQSSGDSSSEEEEEVAVTPPDRVPILRMSTPKLNLGKLKEEEASRSESSAAKAHAALLSTLHECGSSNTLSDSPSARGTSRAASARNTPRDGAAPGSSRKHSARKHSARGGPTDSGTFRTTEVSMEAAAAASATAAAAAGPRAPTNFSFALDLGGDANRASPLAGKPPKPLRGTSTEGNAALAAMMAADVDEASIHSLSTRDSENSIGRDSNGSQHSEASVAEDSSALPIVPDASPIELAHTGTTPTRHVPSDPPAEGEAVKSASRREKKKYARTTVLTKHLGSGSCGSVYVGKCNEEEVAVKVLPLEDDTADAIKREIRILRECECDYIVAYKDAFMREYQMRPTLWVVMEFCHGGSLLDVMRKMGQGYTEPCIAIICQSVLRALDYMHVQRKAIHRDIKSANVLLTSDGRVKLADLGVVAQLFNTMSKRGTMIGTPHWMAPETLGLSGGATGYNTKVDIWSLGITAIECAEQKPPFSNTNSIYETMMHIVQGPPAVLARETNASPGFQSFVASALIKEPLERPSAADLLQHPFLQRASQEELKGVVQYVLGGAPHSGITTI